MFRYPIEKTPINFNLTNNEQTPILGRDALLTLVDWHQAISKRSALIERDDLEQAPSEQSTAPDVATGRDSASALEAIESEQGRK